MGPHETTSLLKLQVHNYTIGPTNWDYKEVSVINSLRGDAITRIVYRQTDRQTDNGVSHKLDWSRPVELKMVFAELNCHVLIFNNGFIYVFIPFGIIRRGLIITFTYNYNHNNIILILVFQNDHV